MPSPFDYANSIDKRHYIEDMSGYSAFIINKKLSLSLDTLFYANEMNLNSHIDDRMQYDYYYNAIRPLKKRPFTKWIKDAKPDGDIAVIMEYFQYSHDKAKQLLSILQEEDLEKIRDELIKGGQT